MIDIDAFILKVYFFVIKKPNFMNRLYFTQHNHSKNTTTEDFVKTFGGMFQNIDLRFANKIHSNEKNLILDEFTRFHFIDELIKVKKKSNKTKIFLIFTEYIYNNKTFNQFGKNSFFTDFKVSLYKLIYNYSYKLHLFEKNNFQNKFKNPILKTCSILFRFIWETSGLLIKKVYKFFLGDSLYMYYRYRGFKRIEKYVDCYLIWNNEQKFQLEKNLNKKIKIIYFLPELKKIKKKNKVGISISGFKSRYRVKLIKTLINKVKSENNFNNFLNSREFLFKEKFYTYSLNPGRNKDWPYPSLIRYAFSINNSEIPIVIDKFQDNFTVNTSLYINIEDIKNNLIFTKSEIEKNMKLINLKLNKYKKIYSQSKSKFEKLVND
jgi:hypothetical protein